MIHRLWGVARVGRNEQRELRRMVLGWSVGYDAAHLTHLTQTISRFSVTAVAFDVGARSRRRASEPKADQAARSAVRAGSANLPAAQGGAVWQAPASARSAGAFRRLRGGLLFGYFFLAGQEKVTFLRRGSRY